MKIGIIGSGFMGGTHAKALAKVDGVEIVSVSSRSQEKADKLAAEVGAAGTTDDMSIINDESLDAVSITSPTHLHKEQTIAALAAGKHVLVEKPLALTVEDCDEMLAAQEKSGKFLMVAHVLRFWLAYVSLVELVHSGKLGKPLAAVATRLSVLPGWADWFLDPALSGGAVLDLSVHDFDALNWVFGQPKSVYARGQEHKPGLWNHVQAIVDYDGAAGTLEGSEFMPQDYPFTARLKVLCEGGTVEFNFRAGGVSVEMGGGSTLIAYEPGKGYEVEASDADPYDVQCAYFAECVMSNQAPTRGTGEQARLAVATALAARKSLETGELVTL